LDCARQIGKYPEDNIVKVKNLLHNWMAPVMLDRLYQLKELIEFGLFSNKELLHYNRTLEGVKKGKRAFLIATGPSIKNEDLSFLFGEDCYSVSNFYLHNDIASISPKYHFFAPYHKPMVLSNYVDWLHQADRMLPSSTNIFLATKNSWLIQKYNLFPKRNVNYIYLGVTKIKGKVDLLKPMMGPQTGPLMILPVLLYMEYSEIYLLGCDHTVLRDYKKPITHFYANEGDIRTASSDEKAWEGIIESHRYSLNVFLQYEYYKELNERYYHANIVNISGDSWLDSFERIEFSEARKRLG